MTPNPALGVFLHWLGGLASGSFYVPYRGVKHWAWETFWLAGGIFSWIIAPWFLGLLITKDLGAVLSETPRITLFWTFFFGLLWGIGGLTFGLTMRYLGLSLGMAVVLGLCAAFGTLMPPIFRGEFMTQVLGTKSGRVILLGIVVCLAGIALAGLAGLYKERVMSPEQQKAAIKEFNLKGSCCGYTVRGHERLFCLRVGSRRSHQVTHAEAWHAGSLAGTAGIGCNPNWGLHHEFHMVCGPQYPEQDRTPVFPLMVADA
jgi:hypothetical protein